MGFNSGFKGLIPFTGTECRSCMQISTFVSNVIVGCF